MRKSKLRNVILYVLVLILALGLFVYDNMRTKNEAKSEFTYDNYLKNPEKHGDTQIEAMGRVKEIRQGYFYFDVGAKELKVLGNIKKPVLGENVAFLDFRKDGTIHLIEYHNYNYNYFLYFISFVALLVFIFIFFKEWKITPRGFKNA